MSLFKRITTTLVSRIDHLAGELENHEALVQATIEKMQRKTAAAKMRLKQIQREMQTIQQDITKNQQQAALWRQRALDVADNEESKALECVSRAQLCDQKIIQLQHACQQYQLNSEQLNKDLGHCEQALADIKQKHKLMRAKQATGEAMQSIANNDRMMITDINDTFDRWEMSLNTLDTSIMTDSVDSLEQAFTEKENKAALQAELAALKAKEASHE